ncbi:MAG: hypothetical protein EOM80_14690 [Erysipelotrichia bacterium]|nr:hypothetical protein [Erysipelotrichia bacterium]
MKKMHYLTGFLWGFAGLTLALNAASDELPAIFKTRFDVGGQFYDYQNYHGVPYFHGGLDLCAPAATDVYTPVTGKVRISDYKIEASANPHRFIYTRKPFKKGDVSSTRYLEVAVTENTGNIWMFRHIDPSSVPDEVFRCAADRSEISSGSMIGKVGRWLQPVLPEKGIYNHIHLEIIASDGAYLNPAQFVKTGKDYYPPVIHSLYAARHDTSDAIILENGTKVRLKGKIDLIAGVNDRMNHAAYQHAIYRANWSLERVNKDSGELSAIETREVVRFDRLPFKGERVQLSRVIYRDQIKTAKGRVQANGNSGPRFFLLNLTSGTTQTGYSADNCLDTRKLANGRYRLNLTVEDKAGNQRQKSYEFIIDN